MREILKQQLYWVLIQIKYKIRYIGFNVNLFFLDSFKEIFKSEIITEIMKQMKAILIATDIETSSKAVKKLVNSLNAKIFSPKTTFLFHIKMN